MEQLLAMNVAAILTQAACGSSGGNNNISSDLSDPQVRAKNLQAWETFRAYYQAVVQSLNDTADWPVPNIPVGSFLAKAVAWFEEYAFLHGNGDVPELQKWYRF